MPQPHTQTDGDIYVNAGDDYGVGGDYYPGTPEGQDKKIQEEKAPELMSLPIMPAVAKWFRDQAANAPDIANIETKSLTINGVKYSRTVSIEGQVLAYQLLQELLIGKAKDFEKFMGEDDD